MANNDKITILYVDDELNNLVSFKAVFRIKYNIYTAISGEEAISILKNKAFMRKKKAMTCLTFITTK